MVWSSFHWRSRKKAPVCEEASAAQHMSKPLQEQLYSGVSVKVEMELNSNDPQQSSHRSVSYSAIAAVIGGFVMKDFQVCENVAPVVLPVS